ncbi:DUF724 domain-containing protein 6 [Glycine soja]
MRFHRGSEHRRRWLLRVVLRDHRLVFCQVPQPHGLREVVNLHQLRTLPPPEKHQEFKFRDKVGAFHNDSLWEGHITQKLGNGRFCVYFPVSEENMVFSKNKLRTHYKWINHNWVFPITNHKRRDKRDMISELPDGILMHLMSFMERCSSLSCKCKKNFKKFVSWVLFSGDHSCSLLSVDIMSWIESEALDVFIEYVMLHNVQQLTMHIGLSSRPNLDSLPLVFCSKSLASLQLSGVHDSSSRIVLSKSLHLHALTSLHLECVYFTSIDNDCAEPFSNCPVEYLFVFYLYFNLHKMAARSLISQFNDASIPCFFRLESLKVKNQLRQLSDGDINKVMEYLLQNSPKARVDIISA